MLSLKVGDKVETRHAMYSWGGSSGHTNYGTVERVTPTQYVVRNEWGNACRYYRKNGRAVGAGTTLYFIVEAPAGTAIPTHK